MKYILVWTNDKKRDMANIRSELLGRNIQCIGSYSQSEIICTDVIILVFASDFTLPKIRGRRFDDIFVMTDTCPPDLIHYRTNGNIIKYTNHLGTEIVDYVEQIHRITYAMNPLSYVFKNNFEIIPLSQQSLKPQIKNVIFNDPATIVFWTDGTKTVVKAQDDDVFDPEKGLAMAISKKALGNKGNYCNELKKWLPKEEPVSDGDLIIAKELMAGLMAGLDAKPFNIKLPDLSGLKTAAENMNLLSKALKDEDYQEKPAKYDRETERKDIEANRMALCDHFVDFAMGKRGNIHEEYMKELKRSKVQKAYNILVACRDKCEGFDFDELIGYLGEALED